MKTINMRSVLLVTAISTMVCMGLFEHAKDWFFFELTKQESHIVTIFFTTFMVTGMTSFWYRKYIDVLKRNQAETDRRLAAEKEISKQKKIEGIIEVGGTLCHEVNQPLTVLMGYTDILLMRIPADQHDILNRVNEIKKSAASIADITRKLNNVLSSKKFVSMDYLNDGSGRKILDISSENATI